VPGVPTLGSILVRISSGTAPAVLPKDSDAAVSPAFDGSRKCTAKDFEAPGLSVAWAGDTAPATVSSFCTVTVVAMVPENLSEPGREK
jgi:hypothetical protein